MADVLRLQNKPAKDVQKELDRALQINPGDRDALLVSALLAAREKKPADARTILAKLDSGDGALEASGDVRARWRTAMLAFAAADNPAATKAAEEVLAAQAEHVGAQKLLERLRDTVASSDPMPPEDPDPEPKHGTGSGSGSGSTTHNDPEPAGDYDSLLKKADQLAEVNCANAMPYYAKALAVKPNGVGALAGRGYCYIDAKQFSQAFSSFRAALTVSSKYEPALWGMAEAYQQQGLKDKALEAYMDYLAVYPNSAKAKKQIERLGGSVPGPDEPKPDEPKPDEPKPDEPKPDEPKPDEGAGSGTP
jgi:tetratricopeptide (TPR) repeat protein